MPTSMREIEFSFAASEMRWKVRGPTDGYAADIVLAKVKVFSSPKNAMSTVAAAALAAAWPEG